MAEFFPFVLTTGQTVYLNPEHIVSIRFNGGFYLVTTIEISNQPPESGKPPVAGNRIYEVKELPFELE